LTPNGLEKWIGVDWWEMRYPGEYASFVYWKFTTVIVYVSDSNDLGVQLRKYCLRPHKDEEAWT